MSLYNVKKIQVSSVLKALPIIFAIPGAIIGYSHFFFFSSDLVAGLDFGARLLSCVVFIVLYTVVMVVGAIIAVWLYNLVASKFNGSIVVSLEAKE
jgi:hypothetical protein